MLFWKTRFIDGCLQFIPSLTVAQTKESYTSEVPTAPQWPPVLCCPPEEEWLSHSLIHSFRSETTEDLFFEKVTQCLNAVDRELALETTTSRFVSLAVADDKETLKQPADLFVINLDNFAQHCVHMERVIALQFLYLGPVEAVCFMVVSVRSWNYRQCQSTR